MRRYSRYAALMLAACILLSSLCGCSGWWTRRHDKPVIVATLFPSYDFARSVVGDKFDVTLLLPPGAESHSYDPTAADIAGILSADIFLSTGALEPWTQTILAGTDRNINAIDLSEGIDLICSDDHDHDEDHDHEHHHEEGEMLTHNHDYDAHIWTSPANAIVMVQHICDAVCAVDGDNAEFYRANAAEYIARLEALDEEFFSIVSGSDQKTIVMSGKFALGYFTERYGIAHISAFDTCSHEAEPSVRTIADIITFIDQNNVKAIYYEELCDPKTAAAISEATGAQPMLLHSCHNLSKDEFERGETYLSLMERNAENLRRGLN